ncbi:MAG: serine acetyltransferase [Muribaculaceae bacterium]|nr:serine acetyltransferase [Muribaculaceae bacterium]
MKRRIIIILLFTPLYVFFLLHGIKTLRREVDRWLEVLPLPKSSHLYINTIELTSRFPEFRTLLYYRYRINEFNPIRLIYPGQMMSISCPEVGEGLVIQHGFGTRIGCGKIGKNCQVWQGVTIGKSRSGIDEPRPIIGDNVKIYANSLVLGGITIGDNAVIGAASVVLKSVPANCTVVGNPARIVKPKQ